MLTDTYPHALACRPCVRTLAASLAALAAAWFVALPVAGRVFQLRGLAGGASLFGSFPGWHLLSSSAVRVNGTPGALEVWGCDEEFGKVLSRLRDMPGFMSGIGPGAGDGTIAVGFLRADGVTVRIVAIPGNQSARCVVVAIRQSNSDATRAVAVPASAGVAGIPAIPGTRTVFSMVNSDTRGGIDVSFVPGTAAAVRGMAESALARAGWTRLLPRPGSVSDGISVFTRGAEVCWLTVSAGSGKTEAIVTLLHKPLELE